MFKRLFAATLFSILSVVGAKAQPDKLTAHIVETQGDVLHIVQTPAGTYIETTRGTYRIEECLCDDLLTITQDVIRDLPEGAPDGALPDGSIATHPRGNIRQAWYGQPTERYRHCVLGDCVEGGSLVAVLASGEQVEMTLPKTEVFEDITPRLHDIGNDGTVEVITIVASNTGGARVSVFGLIDGALGEKFASSENGQRNRWLNIVGVIENWPLIASADKNRTPTTNIYFVRTPHIGGKLSVLRFKDGAMIERNQIMTNVSNHTIGSRVLNMTGVFSEKSGPSFFLPSQDRRSLRPIKDQSNYEAIALPGAIDKPIITLGNLLVTATEDGRLIAIKL